MNPITDSESGDPWSHPDFMRIPMSSLLKFVSDNSKPGAPHSSRVPFNYKLVKYILDKELRVGAVFESSETPAPAGPPKVVIAFRGTKLSGAARQSDIIEDIRLFGFMVESARYKTARNVIEEAVNRYGVENVCLTGHSLGCAYCLMAGRDFAERGQFIKAHVFNPPFPTFSSKTPLLTLLHDFLLTLTAIALEEEEYVEERHKAFMAMKKWNTTHVYVNKGDCFGYDYIRYHKQSTELSASRSFRELICHFATKSLDLPCAQYFDQLPSCAKPFYLLPCFHLHVDENESKDACCIKKFRKAHGLEEWYLTDTKIQNFPVQNRAPMKAMNCFFSKMIVTASSPDLGRIHELLHFKNDRHVLP